MTDHVIPVEAVEASYDHARQRGEPIWCDLPYRKQISVIAGMRAKDD